jgi:hypothetical protein
MCEPLALRLVINLSISNWIKLNWLADWKKKFLHLRNGKWFFPTLFPCLLAIVMQF